MKTKLLLGAALLIAPFAAASAQTAPRIKNVIVVVNDGGGPTVYETGRLYNGAPLTTDRAFFKKTWVSTYPLRPDSTTNNTPAGGDAQDPASMYDPAKFWNTTPVAGQSTVAGYSAYPAGFAGYEFSRFAHPDSGNTASSLASGVKTYNNAINVDGSGDPQTSIVDLLMAAKKGGKRTGVVTTVQVSDATPAALGGAHAIARSNTASIAYEMFGTGNLDVIAGAGNPDYDDLGVLRTTGNYSWIPQDLWTDLKAGTNVSGRNSFNFQLVQNKADVDAIAAGTVQTPEKLAMIVRSFTSTQFNRAGETTNPQDPHTKQPYADPLKTDVPTQASMTIAALNAIGKQANKKGTRGFYLMTEAGAVDRAEHANNLGRMVEELRASDETVKAIIEWVNRADTDANWKNTLLIVTADHDHLLYGPQGDTVPFQPIGDNGKGQLPAGKFLGPNHGTGLVPLYAYGAGADELLALATKTDTYTDTDGTVRGHGAYADQTDVGAFLKAALSR